MLKPKWVTVAGISGIVIGCLGIIGSIQLIMTPFIMKFQSEIFSTIQKTAESQIQKQPERMRNAASSPKEVFSMINKMWDVPEWFSWWCVTAGILSIVFSGFQVFASIWFWQVKKKAVKLFFIATGIVVLFVITEIIVNISANSFIGMSMISGNIFWIIINVGLLIPVAVCNKNVFTTE